MRLLLSLVFILGIVSASAATITGTLSDVTGTAVDDTVFFTRLDMPYTTLPTGGQIFSRATSKVTTTSGSFSTTLQQGTYAVRIQGYTWNIRVPNSTNTFSVTNPSITAYLTAYTETGAIEQQATLTASGTTGGQTINLPAGRVNFAAAATTLTVTNSLVTTNSLIFATLHSDDTTAKSAAVVPGTGTFAVTLNAAATSETAVGWFVVNPIQ